jgi:uncharacterized membrane protein
MGSAGADGAISEKGATAGISGFRLTAIIVSSAAHDPTGHEQLAK